MVDSGWKRLHFHNQESSWTMVDTGTFDNGTAEHLLLYIYTNGTTNQGEPHIRFNGSGENDSYGNGKYSYRVNSDLEASDAGADAQNWLSMKGDQYGGWTMIKMHIIAKKGHNKLIWWNNTRTHGNTGGDDGQGVGQWVNITENITSIQIKEENGDTMNAGLNILVLGADDGTSTVAEKDKSAITDVPVGTRYEETDTRKIFRLASGQTFSQETHTGQELFNDVEVVGQMFTTGSSKIGLVVASVEVLLKWNSGTPPSTPAIECWIGDGSGNCDHTYGNPPISGATDYGSIAPNILNTSAYQWIKFTPASSARTLVANDAIMIRYNDASTTSDTLYMASDQTGGGSSTETGQYSPTDDAGWNDRNFDYCYKINVDAGSTWKEKGTA